MCDRGYTDYDWHKSLTVQGIGYVTRQKGNAVYQVITRNKVDKCTGVRSDSVIRYTARQSKKKYLPDVRQVIYDDEMTGEAVMTQIWIAMCMSLLLAFIKFSNTIAALSFDIFEILREKRVGIFCTQRMRLTPRRKQSCLIIIKIEDSDGCTLRCIRLLLVWFLD